MNFQIFLWREFNEREFNGKAISFAGQGNLWKNYFLVVMVK